MTEPTREASDVLIKHWQSGTTLHALPESLRPAETADGYKIQEHILRLTKEPLFGWKIAATSAAGQHHINVNRPLAGRILQERVTKHGNPVPLGPNRMQVAELEFVFRMGKTLAPRPPPYQTEEVMAAVDGLFLGVEVPDSRYEDFTTVGAAQLIADNACADRFVLGPEVTADWRNMDLPAHIVKGWKGDGVGKVEGSGAAVLGDPAIALTWLTNELSGHGMELGAGQFVTTGTCIIPIPVLPGDVVVGDYGDFGSVQLPFTE
ncbi:hypothetical protein LTR09_010785 [Extremus antarcticus]|uniref:Fumarylacetoacetase-like C-terminal domain-containing protein n=1 Tax=Extremus antarcticus TaxID=702011 RepID=A0AAJ0G8B8_9PEZI|nr:hypothetical protein LTR09_010785 [Extremus antarcticus]